ncbi:MAG: M48 family metalloprotease [Gammaproteobacteria bacterium]|nr:M48 family metalloprotease [Gammaproteobacteria bacterium]
MTNTYSSACFFGLLSLLCSIVALANTKRHLWILIIYLIGAGQVIANDLPDIKNAQSNLISPQQEQLIGRLVAGNLNRLPSSQALGVRLWLTDLVRPLLNHSSLTNKQLQMFLINDRSINAFAAPGGIIGVHTGLVLKMQHVDELVAVLAHEIAHISQRHYAHRRASEERRAPIYLGALLTTMVLATQVDAQLGEAGFHATYAAMMHEQMSYSRANEQEADRVGLDLMQASHFDTHKMLSALKQLDSPFVEQDPNWAWARSHPISEHRVADIASRVEQLSAHPSSPHYQLDFQLLRIMLATQLTDTTKQSLEDVSKRLDPLADHYALYLQFAEAMLLMKQQQWLEAGDLLEGLATERPTQPFIWNQWLRALLMQGQYQQVIEISQEYADLGLHQNLSRYYQALAYAAIKDMDKAYQQLNQLIQAQPDWIGGWQLLADWRGQTADFAKHRIAKAQWHLLRAEFELAQEQALLGEQLTTTSDQQRQQLKHIQAQAKALKETANSL